MMEYLYDPRNPTTGGSDVFWEPHEDVEERMAFLDRVTKNIKLKEEEDQRKADANTLKNTLDELL